eukprot:3559284-Pleurochrysis_carterae.AAC.3
MPRQRGAGASRQTAAQQTKAMQAGAQQTSAQQTSAQQMGAQQTGAQQTGPKQAGAKQTGAQQTGTEADGGEAATKGMTLMLGGKTISVPNFDTLRDAGAKQINNNEFAQRRTGNFGLHFCFDASWKTDRTYIAHLGKFANGHVNWSFRLLKVAASSCQAETAASCVAGKRNTTPLRNLFGHLLDVIGTKLNGGAIVLLVDNSAAVEQADHAGASKKAEHYKRWEYYLRECQLDGSITAQPLRLHVRPSCRLPHQDSQQITFLKLRQHLIR